MQPERDLLTESEAAEFLTVVPRTLEKWRRHNCYRLPFVRVGRSIRYRRSALEAWLQSRTADEAGEQP